MCVSVCTYACIRVWVCAHLRVPIPSTRIHVNFCQKLTSIRFIITQRPFYANETTTVNVWIYSHTCSQIYTHMCVYTHALVSVSVCICAL